MNRSFFWVCENNCVEVLISKAVSEHILWADSRDKPISLLLPSGPNSLWLMDQRTEACRGKHTHIGFPHRNRHGHTFLHTYRLTSVTLYSPRQVEIPRIPDLTELYLKNDLKTNPERACVFECGCVCLQSIKNSWKNSNSLICV